MSRDLVLATTALLLGGAGCWLASWIPDRRDESGDREVSGRRLERGSWRRIWLTMLPLAVAVATMVGWGLQEPAVTDEPLGPTTVLVALPLALLWLRALARAGLALRRPRRMPPISTIGFLRPKIVVADETDRALDPQALAAAVAHERAHVRHRDPARIWLAQVATDLQWPCPRARRRFQRWLTSLELARDEEARVDGASGADLAAAVVAVATMGRLNPGAAGVARAAIARLTGAEASIKNRIQRLLAPVRTDDSARSAVVPVSVVLSLALGLILGVAYGDELLRALPFVAA